MKVYLSRIARAACCVHTHLFQPLKRPESNYRIQCDNTTSHSLSHTDERLEFAINLNFPLDPDMAFAVPAAGAKLNIRGHKC